RDERLEAAAPPAAPAGAAVPVDRHVPELAAVAGGAPVELPVDHGAAADSGRDRQVDHVARPDARAEAMLGRGGCGAVVLEQRGTLERALGERSDRHVAEAGK